MAVSFVSIDIYYNNMVTDCLSVTDGAATYYIPWDHLSAYDKDVFTDYIDNAIFTQPLTKAQLVDPTKLLPNGMTAWSTYKGIMRFHPATPETISNMDDVSYIGGAWKYTATGDATP